MNDPVFLCVRHCMNGLMKIIHGKCVLLVWISMIEAQEAAARIAKGGF